MEYEPIVIDISGMLAAISEFLDVFLGELFAQLSSLFTQLAEMFAGFVLV